MQGAVVTPFTNFFLDLLAKSNQTNKISVQPTNQPTKTTKHHQPKVKIT